MAVNELAGRPAVVTGAGAGIGEAVARTLAAAGAPVLVADIDGAAAQRVADRIRAAGGTAEAVEVDVTDVEAVEAMVDRCLEAFGELRIGVNNAGIHGDPSNPPVADYTLEWWDRVMATNLNSVFYCLRAEARAMRAGVVGLTRAAALDHAADGIRVNAVGPGFIQTGLVERNIPESERPAVAALHALGRLGEPGEVAALVAFLAGDGASFMTGNYFPVEGGLLSK